MTDSSSLLALYVHSIFMAFPFLWEFRIAVDWTFSPDTSLSLFMWLKLEDIYAGLCAVRMSMKGRRQHAKGQRQSTCMKLSVGGGVLLAMLFITVGPLVLFSPASPLQQQNELTGASASLYVSIDYPQAGALPPVTATSFGGRIELGTISRFQLTYPLPTAGQFSARFGEWATDWWGVRLATATEDQWLINNASLAALHAALAAGQGARIQLGVTLSITRATGESWARYNRVGSNLSPAARS